MPVTMQWPLCIPPEPVKDDRLRIVNAASFVRARQMGQALTREGKSYEETTTRYARFILSGMLVFGEKGPLGSTPMMLWG